MQVRELLLIPALAAAATTGGMFLAPTAIADCNSVGNSTLCSSGGSVRGSSGAPSGVPVYDPYPCVDDPLCYIYDDYDPGAVFDPPDVGIGGPGIGGGGIGGGGIGGGGIGGGGIGPR
ncbi:MAG: hypothetical protein QG671_91 [Actinomycetota bacterium]|nr:hypothetical protein [Actinomycetota bacterium]